jgi:HPt (histidine-containing phosphotransfer) domain-containing protein
MRAFLLLVLFSGCATGLSAARRAELEADAQPSLAALQAAKFDEAKQLSAEALKRNPENSRAAGVSAIAQYRQTLHDLFGDVMTIASSAVASAMFRGDIINRDFLTFMLDRADKRLSEVDATLAIAEKDPGFSMDLCLACWEVDWNRSGEIDERDRHLLEIERDAQGEPLAEDDPKRRPTFRFDVADVSWLRAMVNFQRAAIAVGGAYDPNVTFASRNKEKLVLKLRDGAKLLVARDLALAGLKHASKCRELILAETDDEREWVPNPRQKSHAMPLEVDDALFETWAGVLSEVEKLLKGEEGISVAELAQLGRHRWENPPGGYLDLGALLTQPRDLVVDREELRALRREDAGGISEMLGRVFGPAYKTKLPPSHLIERMQRMRKEIDRNEDTFERKLRYLLWLN